MNKHLGLLTLAALVVVVLLVYTITFQVDELKDIVLIETFGEVTRSYVGPGGDDAGLWMKWPWPVEKVIRYDARAHVFEDTYLEVATRDKQNLLVTMYCTWRIKDPRRFHTSVKSRDPAQKIRDVQERIRDLVRNFKQNAVGTTEMAKFVNTDPKEMKIDQVERKVLDPVRLQAEAQYGVEIVRLGMKSLGLSQKVAGAVIDSMKEERQRDVKRFESQGEAQARAIEARAEAARDQIVAFAERKAEEIRAEGAKAAAKYYRKFSDHPEFSVFLRSLESLKKELASRTVFLLDGSELPSVKWFRDGPSLPTAPGREKASAGQ